MADNDSKTTVDHDTIQRWVEKRSGMPVEVAATDAPGEAIGIVRIAFEDDPNLSRISWAEWFAKFEENQLAFLYQEETAGGELSRFCKLVDRS